MTPPSREATLTQETRLSFSVVQWLLGGIFGLTIIVVGWLLRIETHVNADEFRQASFQAADASHEAKLNQLEKDITEIKVNIANMAGQAGIKYEIVRKPGR